MRHLPFSGEEWLVGACRRRTTRQNKNAIISVIGPTGSGKSWGCLRFAELLDPGFTVDRVCFEPQDLIRLVNSGLPAGSVVMLDEAGVKAGARNWRSETNKALSALFQSFRFLNLALFFSVPDASMADVHIRSLSHYLLEMTDGINEREGTSFCKPFVMEFVRGDEPRPVYPVFQSPEFGVRKLKLIRIHRPSEPLIIAYEAKKKAWLNQLYASMGKTGVLPTQTGVLPTQTGVVPTQTDVSPTQPGVSVTQTSDLQTVVSSIQVVVCPYCGHTWPTRPKRVLRPRVRCSKCHREVKGNTATGWVVPEKV